ncbi:MAG: hypothetical protein IJX81_03400 [Clostridia bacterium]|nr:hypothetical protein [Clostridia bacterium]
MEKFVVGLLVGGVVGALAVTNNRKVHALVKKGQDEILTRIDELVEEKLENDEQKKSEEKSEEKPKKRAVKKA